MAPTRPLRSLALLLGFCIAFGFAPNALTEPLDAPIALGSFDTPGGGYGVSAAGTLAYVADGSSGLRVILPAVLTELGSIHTPGWASGVSVVGTRAYVADGGGGLRVIDSIAIPAPVPEPGALLLQIAAGATLLGVRARRRRGA